MSFRSESSAADQSISSLPFTASCKRAFLSSDVVDDVCCLAIAREDGQVLTFRIPNWSTLTGTSKDNLQAYCKERVHVARMNYLFSQATMTGSDDEFLRLMKSFENVKDHNLVGEICFSGAVTFENYERITNLLTYAKKRAIT
ncbi:hypothetical protein OSTOST_22476, partial [Ostertagia ostertagi]